MNIRARRSDARGFGRFYPECRTILISGNPNAAVLRSGHTFLLLQKPIHPEKLLEYVSDALHHLQKAA